MPGIPGFATANGGGAGEGTSWTQVRGRGGGRGGRGGRVGYGRGGRGIDGGETNKFETKTNQYDHFGDSDEVEDVEDDEEDEDVKFFADEEADKQKQENKDKANSEGKADNHKKGNEGTNEENDFITEEEMNRNRRNEEDTSSEMVGVQTVIQKKRSLSTEEATDKAPAKSGVKLDFSEKTTATTGKYGHLSSEETKQLIKDRGEKMVETNTTMETTAKIEFNLNANTTQFSVRQATVQLFSKMKKLDPTVTIFSVQDQSKWEDPTQIPSDAAFGTHFNVREEHYPRGPRKVVVHFKLQSKTRMGDIKFDPTFFNYLKQNHIYLKVDKFEMRKMASPGFLIDIHPNLTNLNDLHEGLARSMESTKVKDSTTIDEWRAKNPDRLKMKNSTNEIDNIIDGCRNTIPTFHIHSGKRAFGAETSRVETLCLIIQCAEVDAQYIKALLSSVYANGEYDKGMFVPSGMHLIEGPAVLCNLLRRHNKYLASVTAVPIFGLKASAMDTIVILDSAEQLDMSHFLKQYITFVETIERTNKTESEGKWFFLCKKPKVDEVHNFIDTTLKELYSRFVKPEDLIQGFSHPRRNAPTTSNRPAASKIVGTYASVLRKYSSNPQDDEVTSDDNAQYNQAPDRPRKRQAVQLLFDSKNFPAISGASPTQATPSTVTQAVPTTTQSEIDQKLASIENKLQTQITNLQEQQDAQMKNILTKFEDNVQTMMASMNTMMENITKTIQDLHDPHKTSANAVQHLVPFNQTSPHGGLPNTSVASPSTQSNSTEMGVGALKQ